MKNFGETLRGLRVKLDLGLRETATKAGISPAYLSRIERGKEKPPRPDVIKKLANLLETDPDQLFRLTTSTDPEVTQFLNEKPQIINLVRFIKETEFSDGEIKTLITAAQKIKNVASTLTNPPKNPNQFN